MDRIVAIVLAAGSSRRMGRDKLGLPWHGSTVLECALRAYTLAREVHEVIVVLRPDGVWGDGSGLRAPFSGRGATHDAIRNVRCVPNPLADSGMASSLRLGVASAPEGVEAFVLGLGDMPELEAATVDGAIRRWRQAGVGILRPVFRDRPGHPVIMAARHRFELLACQGDAGAREIMARHPDDTVLWPVEHAGVVFDVDTREQLGGAR
jgi:molybdenum cofactor cytidylyltransferase